MVSNCSKHVKEKYPSLPVIIMTAFSDLDSTVTAFQGGAFDYLAKPFDINEAVALIQRAVREPSEAQEPLASVCQNTTSDRPSDKGILTQSSSVAMQEVFGRLDV
jgi:two-component system, NtrC family, nitrogen regulation response regulator GlnG